MLKIRMNQTIFLTSMVDGCFLDEDEKRAVKKSWEFLNADWLKEQAAKEAALKTASDAFNASNANCPEYARNLVEASKASVSKSRKEKRQKREEEAKNAPPASTALEACTRVLESKKLSKYFNPDRLKELFNPDRLKERFDTSSGEKSPKKSRTETVIENKKEVEIEEEEDGYDFGFSSASALIFIAMVSQTNAASSASALIFIAMVSQTNAAGSSARRRRRSTPIPREQARQRKANRYPGTANGFICFSFSELDSGLSSDSACYHWNAEFIQGRFSDSDEDKRASSMDSTAPTSPPVNAANVIGAVASALTGLTDMDILLCSQFGRLFHLPAARCHNSTKLIGSLLCRHLITARKYELWYTFATHPLRFSLDEFHSITGLNCGAFNVEDSDSEEAAGSVMWQKLFDTTVGDITVAKVLEMLHNPFLAGWKRLALALIALVDGVLCCTNKNLKLTPKHPSPLHELRIRLSQQTTACYGFPLALQLLAFEVVPQLLARIPDAPNTATFSEDPSACATTMIILNTKDILAIEAEPDVTVHFSLIPKAERHMWLDEVEDLQVDRLVHHLSSGHTFTTEDFRGGEKSFRGRGKQPENAPIPPKDKPEVVPIIQRNLRLCKPAAVVVEDVTSSEHNKPEVPHQSGSSPDKDLKLWLFEQLQNMARGIYERLETMERNICSHLGVSPPNVHNTRKRKADDDSPKTDGIQAERSPRKSRRTNSTFTKPATKIHSYPQRSGRPLTGLTPPYFNKESRDDNDYAHDRTPPFDEHVNYQEPRTPYAVPDESNAENPVTTVTVYNPLIFVRPQSYVSPTKSVIDELPCISDLTPTKRFGDEIPVTVTWEETNPHAYTSGKIAPASETPPSAASPVEEDENYESCQENISIDTPLQEKHHLAIETLPGPDTDEDENSVESGGKRLRKKSQKIRGVYTPDARLKGLFMSEKKTEYRPLPKTSRAIFKKFSDILSENLVQFEIKTSHIVTNSFFLDIATPGKWLSDEHMHVIMQMLWRRRGSFLQKERIVMFDPYFTKIITSKWPTFNEAEDKLDFDWGTNIAAYFTGKNVTSSEHNEPEVPHQSGSSPDKDLKLWLSEQLQNVARGINEHLETMERNICSHLGVSPPNVHNTRKRKADDDSPKTDGIQAQRPPHKSRRTNSTVTKPAMKIHSYPQRSADRLQGNIGRTPPYFNKESRDDNDCAHDRTPPFDEHVNYQEPRAPYAVPNESNAENPVTTVIVYNPLIFVRPQSYVSPTKMTQPLYNCYRRTPLISDLSPTKRFGDEKHVTVTWEETNPHAYTSGKIALASETPPSTDVETLSRDVSAIKTQSAAVTEGAARDSVAVGNERSPVEEDENYESCQENISIDTPLQEKHPLAVETLPGPDTDEDDNSVESGGKRLRKKSQKIRGVYTPDARLKGLFMSEKKTEYRPLPKTSRAIFKKFNDTLSENLVQQFEIKISHIVTNSFFLDIATPVK
ncbi:hypothetical protein DY000_02030391 [Brassica cretica]|uniref:DUF1985 domain-containing protein n=1 Tax=Brassica cretica TaxID=69181 RepID=A0ABQ7DG23_BRACR|nr:hypothetical protein DY000_02030391 [Brassica cretica]